MISNFIDYFASFDFLKDIFLIILGALLSYIYSRCKDVWKLRKSKKILAQNMYNDKILTIDSAFPAYSKEDIITELSDEVFFLSIPTEELNTLRTVDPNYMNRENRYFTADGTLADLGKAIEVEAFESLVEKHRKTVAKEFIEKIMQGQEIFNNEKLGIRKIIRSRTNSSDESSVLRIRFFKTDYFTHRVMRAVYAEMRQAYTHISSINEINDINRYYPLMTSLGVNSLLLLESENFGRAIVLSKRTKTSANMSYEQWHVSMNEGVNLADISGKTISLEHCVRRGCDEELGIRGTLNNEFTDLFLVRDTFEIGIASIVTTSMTAEDFEKSYAAARDRALETLNTQLVPDNTKDIKRFMKEHKDTTDIAKYCLSMYVGRRL